MQRCPLRLTWNGKSRDLEGLDTAPWLAKLQPGIVVAICAPIAPMHVVALQAAMEKGCVLAPLPGDHPATFAAQAEHIGADLVVASPGQDLGAWRGPVLRCDGWGNLEATQGPTSQHGNRHAAVAFGEAPLRHGIMVSTSGTSGMPRPVLLSFETLRQHALAASARIRSGPGSVWLASLRPHHVGGAALLHRALATDCDLVFPGGAFDAAAALHLMETEKVTHASLVPTMLRRLAAVGALPESLRCALVGGDHLPESLFSQAAEAGWPVHATYGLTEACSQVTTATPDERKKRPGTSGRPLDGVKVEVVDGEIVVSGPTVAGGGRLHTGDVGHLDADGFLYVAGRRDDRITTGGVKVDPEAVEEVLRAHPGVVDACVVGLPDAEWGARVVAVIVTHEFPGDLRAWCKARLAPACVPKDFHAVDSLPRTEGGKLRRAEVRSRLQAQLPAERPWRRP